MPADGNTRVVVRAIARGRQLSFNTFKARVVEGQTRGFIDSTRFEAGTAVVRIRPAILPGKIVLELNADRFIPGRWEFDTTLLTSDAFGDGTPDFLRLGPDDDTAFRSWFTYLAESQYYRADARLSKEISDCAALIRFAYREALRAHDTRWANDLDLDDAVSFPAVQKYQYPFTPLGADLFRIRDGRFLQQDLTDSTFAQFADAQTLWRFNTHLVSRNVFAAQPGDLLFYRQLDQNLPFHTMIFIGRSHFDPDSASRVVYHTGPIGAGNGEIRRPTLDLLLRHPEPKWRPVSANSNFLGVYRWNILR